MVKRKEVSFEVDEHPRLTTTLEGLAKLPPVFKKNGTVTAGTASGICDGAGAIILASEEACKTHNLKPLARLVYFINFTISQFGLKLIYRQQNFFSNFLTFSLEIN